jgi:hypothetical protein
MRLNIIGVTTLAALAIFPIKNATAGTTNKPQLCYSNFGYNAAYSKTNYYFVSGPVYTAGSYAASFVAGISGTLDHVDLPLSLQAGLGAVVSIFADDNGVPGTYSDGSPLEEWLAKTFPKNGKPMKLTSVQSPTLIAGTKYWIIVAPIFYDSVVDWNANITGDVGVDASFLGGWTGSWSAYTYNDDVTPAFDVWVD